jgi:hypothetical protein
MTRSKRTLAAVALTTAFACATLVAADASVERFAGTFAIPNAVAKTAATLTVARTGPLAADLALVETRDGATVRDYDVDMTKRMHVIAISDDFTSFQHVHPVLGADGRFTLALHVPKPGRYEIYADAEPHGFGQQVFRFSVPFGSPVASAARDLSETSRSARAGPYVVTLDSLALRAGATTMLSVRVMKGGKPATDLHPYLGGAAHAVFIDARTLAYIHVHPLPAKAMASMTGAGDMHGMAGMEMPALPDGAHVEPAMMLHVVAPLPGTYKLWLQFRGGRNLEVAPFVLTAR